MAEEIPGLTGALSVSSLSLTCRLGARAFERIHTRRIPVDLVYRGPLLSGDSPVVDYADMALLLQGSLQKEYLYIEHLAAHIHGFLKSEWPGMWTVTVHKVQPSTEPVIEMASVTVEG